MDLVAAVEESLFASHESQRLAKRARDLEVEIPATLRKRVLTHARIPSNVSRTLHEGIIATKIAEWSDGSTKYTVIITVKSHVIGVKYFDSNGKIVAMPLHQTRLEDLAEYFAPFMS